MNLLVFNYYLRQRPLFMSLVRSTEIAFYQKHLSLGSRVLDFGCGDGFFFQALKQFSLKKWARSQAIGLDLRSNPRVKQIPKKLYQKVDLYPGQKLPYHPNSFDSILVNCVFEHLPNLSLSLKELARVIKPKGKLFTTVMTNNWNKYVRLPGFFWDKVQEHHYLLTAKGWQQQFETAGFQVLKVEGYLNQEQSRLIELSHFLSLPYLISYLLLKRWDTVGPVYVRLVNQAKIRALFSQRVAVKKAGGLFFVLQKS